MRQNKEAMRQSLVESLTEQASPVIAAEQKDSSAGIGEYVVNINPLSTIDQIVQFCQEHGHPDCNANKIDKTIQSVPVQYMSQQYMIPTADADFLKRQYALNIMAPRDRQQLQELEDEGYLHVKQISGIPGVNFIFADRNKSIVHDEEHFAAPAYRKKEIDFSDLPAQEQKKLFNRLGFVTENNRQTTGGDDICEHLDSYKA
jgi:hypothetical protein